MEIIKPKLYNPDGTLAEIPDEELESAVTSGQYKFKKGDELPVVSPSGETGFYPANKIKLALQAGYKIDTPSMQVDRIQTEETSGLAKGLEAGALGLARGATLGLSDVALTESGVYSPEELRVLKEKRGGASLAGEAASFLLPTGAAGALGKIGKSVIGASEAAAAARIAKAFQTGSKAEKLATGVSKIASTALGSAVEGAVYSGVANSISEAALGDPDLNGEKILANFGYGALYGGALGGALKGAQIGVPASVRAVRNGVTKIKDMLVGTGTKDAGAVGKMLDTFAPGNKLTDAIANRMVRLDVDEQAKLIGDLTEQTNTVWKNVDTALETLNKEIRPKELEAQIKAVPVDPVRSTVMGVLDDLSSRVQSMQAKPAENSPFIMSKLEGIRDDLAKKLSSPEVFSSPMEMFNAVRTAKQLMGDVAYAKGAKSMAESESINVLKGAISNTNNWLKSPDVFGQAGSSLAAHDDMLSKVYQYVAPYGKPTEFTKAFMKKVNNRWQFDSKKVESMLKTAEKNPEKIKLINDFYDLLKEIPDHLDSTYQNVPNARFNKRQLSAMLDNAQMDTNEAAEKYLSSVKNKKDKFGLGDYATAAVASTNPIIGAAIGAYNIYTKPLETLNKLAAIERLVGQTTSAVGKGVNAVFQGGLKGAQKIRAPLSKEYFNDLSDKLQEHQNNPEKLIDDVSKSSADLEKFAPNITSGLQASAARASQFLASKLPTRPNDNPFEPKYDPSEMEIAQFNRYLTVVEDPLLALEQVRIGTIVPETIESLQVVYPQLYEQMKMVMIEEASAIVSSGKAIPYQKKQSISMFLGQPLDSQMDFPAVSGFQASFASAPNQNQMVAGAGKPSKTGMQKMDFAGRMSNSRRVEDA